VSVYWKDEVCLSGIYNGYGTQFEKDGKTAYRRWIQNERRSDELARGQLSLLAEMESISN